MFPYLILFGFFAMGAILFRQPQASLQPLAQPTSPRHQVPDRRLMPMLVIGGVLIAVLVGLRYQIGADWYAYELYFKYARYADLPQVLKLSDPAYQLTNWLVQQAGFQIWAVNLVCGAFFAWGLIRFARVQPEPWLTVVVAIPYLVTVVAMGYSRQAVAIGVLLAGLASVLRGGSVIRFSAYVLVAALFHKTAVLALPLVLLAGERNRVVTVIFGLAIFVLMYDMLLAESVDTLIKNYIEAEYNSQGAAVRVGMNVVAALLFLSRPSRFGFSTFEQRVWRYFSWAALGFLVLLFLLPSSTAVDRLALYIFPLQLAVLSRVPIAFPQQGARTAVIIYALAVQLVWLNFAAHAEYWVPYRFYPL